MSALNTSLEATRLAAAADQAALVKFNAEMGIIKQTGQTEIGAVNAVSGLAQAAAA